MKCVYRLTCMLGLAAFAICLVNLPVAVANQDLFQWTSTGDGGWLGVSIQDLTTALKEAMDYDRDVGVLVNDVEDDSPAEQAGLKEGDIIITYDGKSISNTGSLIRKVRASDPGEEVDIGIVRKGKEMTLTATIGEHPKKKELWIDTKGKVLPHVFKRVDEDHGWLGVHLQDVTEQLGEYFGITDGEGALITEVVEDSPAEKAGLRAGDVIVEYDGDEIDDIEELIEAVRETDVDEEVEIRIMRERKSLTLGAKISSLPNDKRKSLFHFFDIPSPGHHSDVYDRGNLFHHLEHYDKDELDDDDLPSIRVYGEMNKDEIEKLKKKIKKLEREIEKIKERL